jgi:hypothetical protein
VENNLYRAESGFSQRAMKRIVITILLLTAALCAFA